MKPNEPEDVRAPRLKDRIAELLRLASSNEDGPSEDQVFGAVKALLNAVEPKSRPEEVQLDVELEKRIVEIQARQHKAATEICPDELNWYGHYEVDVEFLLEQLALLRRVSGKGAQRCPTCQKTIWHPGLQWSMPVPYYCGCPAPVPATPDVRRIQEIASDLAQELLDETRTRHNLEHGCWPGLVHIADKIEKAIKLATTQGTPEGAK